MDQSVLIRRSRHISIHVDNTSIESALGDGHIMAETDLIAQVASILLDNAAKYSTRWSRIEVAGRETGRGNLAITVENTGIRIFPNEVGLCTQRDWRSPAARRVTGEGAGIGLWLAKNIMEAHEGDLVVEATSDSGRTRITLLFPLHRRG